MREACPLLGAKATPRCRDGFASAPNTSAKVGGPGVGSTKIGGYIGESTRSEIEYAEKLGRPHIMHFGAASLYGKTASAAAPAGATAAGHAGK